MAYVMGKDGYITIDSDGDAETSVVHIDTWSASLVADLIDTSNFKSGGGQTSKEFGYGLKSCTGSFSGTLDLDGTDEEQLELIQFIIDTLPGDGGAHVSGKLYMKSGDYLTLDEMLFSSVDIGATVAGKATITGNFTQSGDVTGTWS